MQGPTQPFTISNPGAAAVSVELSLGGGDADLFELVEPASGSLEIPAGGDGEVSIRVVTDNGALGAAPAQDDGATILEADLMASVAGDSVALGLYAVVLTYVELEPTFGQIMGAFPEYTVNLGDALENDANPNPATLPGVEAGTDEVAAQTFVRADASAPVVYRPIARFSPPGQVPYGWYTPGNTGAKTEVGAMAEQSDPHTNNKSRMIHPPLASGGTEFDPGANPFSIYMEPDGVAAIYSQDAQNSDGQHRVKVFELSDGSGTTIPNTYLVAGEEASNGDYQDYVMVISNVTPQ